MLPGVNIRKTPTGSRDTIAVDAGGKLFNVLALVNAVHGTARRLYVLDASLDRAVRIIHGPAVVLHEHAGKIIKVGLEGIPQVEDILGPVPERHIAPFLEGFVCSGHGLIYLVRCCHGDLSDYLIPGRVRVFERLA